MKPNIMRGPFDGSYLPHTKAEYIMLTTYDKKHGPCHAVYWWQPDISRWVYQQGATTEAMAGLIEQHIPEIGP